MITALRKLPVYSDNMLEYLNQNLWVVVLAGLWSLPWKGVALWKAAQRKDKNWFIALLLINTLGILEMYYIFVTSKKKLT